MTFGICACCMCGILDNQTFVEYRVDPETSIYSHGCWANLTEIFGGWDFFLPTSPPVSGFHWEGYAESSLKL